MARKLVLLRHGQTVWNVENRFQGKTDIPLDDVGHAQARRAGSLVAAFQPDAIVSSDLIRTQQTAAPLAAITGLEVWLDSGLRETDGGEWEGLTGTQIRQHDLENFTRWINSEDVVAGRTGERRTEVATRAVAAIHRAFSRLAGDATLIAVTHGGTSRGIIAELLNLPSDSWGVIGGLANCSWSVLDEVNTSRWRLTEHNAGTLPEPVLGEESGG